MAELTKDELAKAVAEQQAVAFYGYSQSEWEALSETRRRAIREVAWDAVAKRGPTLSETQARNAYATDGNTHVYDQMFGDYKYKSFFQSIKDAGNIDSFAYAEGEVNAETQARRVSAPKITNYADLSVEFQQRNTSYSGCDITPAVTIGGKTFVLGNISTLTYSIHRDKVPVRLLGRTYAKSYVSGGATIAGTLIFTVFDTHVLDAIRREIVTEKQASGGQSSPLTQQLPPFDITIVYNNEYGHSSYMRIYGVEITDESQGHSINDIYTENQMQYVARDIDLMCEINDTWNPVALAVNNSTLFSKYALSTPAYKLANIKDNEKQINEAQSKLARQNYRITQLGQLLVEVRKPPTTSEKTNLENAYLAEQTALIGSSSKLDAEIKKLQQANQNVTESMTGSDSTRLGTETSATRDDPYALTRIKSMY